MKESRYSEDNRKDLRSAAVAVLLLWAVVLLLATTAHCEVPDAPSATIAVTTQTHPKLFTSENIIAFSLNAGLRTADAMITCRNLEHGGREVWMSSQTCSGTAFRISLGIPLQIGTVYLFQRLGHPKIARAFAWGMPAGSAAAIAYSVKNGGTR